MRLGFDIDGVLARFEVAFAQEFPHRPMPVGDPAFPPVWHYPQFYGATDAEVDAAWERIKADERFWWRLPELHGRTEMDIRALNELRDRGHDIYFITNRVGKRVKWQTENWLRDRGFFNPTVIIAGDKAPIVAALRLDAYIDDKPSNVNAVREGCPECRVYVMDRPYNQEVPGLRVATIEEMLSHERSRTDAGDVRFAEARYAAYRV
jgi:hypothetical protein